MFKTTVSVPYSWPYPELDALVQAGKTDGIVVEQQQQDGKLSYVRTWADSATAQQYIDAGIAHYGADQITYSVEEVIA